MNSLTTHHAIMWLYTDKLEQMLAFYGETLQLPEVMRTARCRLFRMSGNALIGICQNPARPLGVKGMMVTFVVDDVAAAYEWLRARGVTFDAPPVIAADSSHAFFSDPQGYALEIQQFAPGALGEAENRPAVRNEPFLHRNRDNRAQISLLPK